MPGTETKIRKEYEIISTPPRTKVSLWFDGYDDIFSNFDPRPYSHRIISDDFLNELRKIVGEVKSNNCDIAFLIPKGKINHAEEKVIKLRLHHYFQKESLHFALKYKNILKKGVFITILGMAIMLLMATFVSQIDNEFFSDLLTVILEPTGWFAVWYGLDHIFYVSKHHKKSLDFSKKVLGAEINFYAY